VIVGLVASLTSQFPSSAASEALRRELDGRCSASYAGTFNAASTAGGQSLYFPVSERTQRSLDEAVVDVPSLGVPVATIEGQVVSARATGSDRGTLPLVVLHRSGFRDQVNLLRGGELPGVWIEEFAAEQLAVDVGDEIAYDLVLDGDPRLLEGRLPVAAVIEDLTDRHTEDYWCGIYPLLAPGPFGDRPTPLALVDVDVFGAGRFPDAPAETFLRRSEDWEIPVHTQGITLTEAAAVLATFEQVGETLLGDPERVRSDLRLVRERVVGLRDALETSIRPIGMAIMAAALALMAGAGSYWVDRRIGELRLLTVQGLGPASLGLKASLETVIPVALGVTVGALMARLVADIVGPGGTIEPTATALGLRSAIPAGTAAVLLVGLVAAIRTRRILDEPVRRRRGAGLLRLPILAGLAGGAVLVRTRIGDTAVRFGDNELVGYVDPLVILYPFLLFTAIALGASELIIRLVPSLKHLPVRGHATYLAVRRIGSSPTTVVAVVAGALIPIATLVYSTALTRSTETTVQAKAKTFIGADVRTPIYRMEPLPTRLDTTSTLVRRADRVDFEGQQVDLLAVDTETFARGAFWDSRLSEQPLDELLEILEQRGPDLAAIVANAEPTVERGIVEVGRFEVPVVIEATAISFPGARRDRPIVVVSQHRLDQFIQSSDTTGPTGGLIDYLWTIGLDKVSVQADLRAAGVGFSFSTAAEQTLDQTKFQAVIWTFALLEVYAALAGLIVIGGVLLYADTRQRRRNLSYALSRRMGLRRHEHLLSGFLEIGGLTLSGTLTGVLAAYLAATSIYQSLDAIPQSPPGPLWAGTGGMVFILLSASLVVGALTAWTAQHAADTADVSELLRHGD